MSLKELTAKEPITYEREETESISVSKTVDDVFGILKKEEQLVVSADGMRNRC